MNFEFLNGKNFDISKLKAGLKINSDNEVFKKYDQNNNSIWDREELAKFHSDIDSYIQDGKLDETEAASFFANVMGLTLDAAKKILNSKENKLLKSFEILQNELDSIENDEALAVIDMQNEINSALEVFETAKKGPASTVANGFKELFKTKYAGSKVYRQLMEKQVTAEMLKASLNGQGVPAKEYMQKKAELFKFLIGGEEGISDKEFKAILENITPYEMQMYINKLVNADDKEYSSVRKSIVREIKAKNVNRNNDQIRVNISNQTSVQYLLDSYKEEEILTFEEIYLHELGVPFDPEKINEYRQKEKETQIIMYTFNKINGVCEKLKSAYIVLDDIQRNGMPDTPIGNEEEFIKRQTAGLKLAIVESLQEIYGNNQDEINDFIAKLGYNNIKFENGELVFSGLYSEQILLIDLAKSIEAKLKRNFNENILHGKTLDDVTKGLEESHKNAFGNHNPINLAGEFEKSQETGVEIIKFGTMAGAFILTAGSGSILVTAAGVAVATISGVAIDAAEMKSKKGTLSDDDKKGLLQELATQIAYMPVGVGIGEASAKIASHFPKLLKAIVMIGSDGVMSCLADYIITGEVDLSYETLSELLNIATMIVAHRKISNGKTNSTKHKKSAESPKAPTQEPETKPETTNTIKDNTEQSVANQRENTVDIKENRKKQNAVIRYIKRQKIEKKYQDAAADRIDHRTPPELFEVIDDPVKLEQFIKDHTVEEPVYKQVFNKQTGRYEVVQDGTKTVIAIGECSYTPETLNQQIQHLKNLREFLETQSIPEDIVVYRQDSYDIAKNITIDGQNLAEIMQTAIQNGNIDDVIKMLNNSGIEVKYNNFIGTAMTNNYSAEAKPNIMWEINVPKGSKGAYIEAMTKENILEEAEFLLQAGSSLKIKTVEFKDGTWFIKADLVQETTVHTTNPKTENSKSTEQGAIPRSSYEDASKQFSPKGQEIADRIATAESGVQGRQYYEEILEPNKPVRLDEVEGLILDQNGDCIIDFNDPYIRNRIANIPEGGQLIIGREGDIKISDNYTDVSRRHAVIFKRNGVLYVQDTSKYGTRAVKIKEQTPSIRQQELHLKNEDYETLDGVTDIILADEYRLDLSNYTDYLNRMPEGAYITVGRSSKCDIVVPEKYNHVSGQHLMIIKRNGKIYIKDISTNGTTVYKQTGGNDYNNIKADTPAKSRLLEASGGDKRLLSKMVQVFGKDEAYIDKIASTLNSNNKVILETYLNNPNAVRNGSRSVTKDDLAILMMFNRNNTGSYNLISNPYEVENFLQRAYNEIDNLARSYGYKNYCNNREVRDAILYGETRFKGTLVECSPNHNILNDMENLIHGRDYIKHFRSVNEAIYNTQVGDAVTINGRMYVNDGRQMVPLQLSEQRFRQLFPPMQRFTCHQGEVGDCYLVATIDAMANSGYGRAKLYQMIGEDSNGIYTMCANGNGQKTYFPRFTTKNKNMYDGNGLAIIEAGYCQNSRGNAFNPSMTMIMERNESGWGLEAYHSLTGNSNMTYHSTDSDRNAVMNIIKNAAGREDVIIYAGSKKVDNRGHNIALDPKYDVHQGHAYCVKGYDAVTDCVLISNPWHSGVEIKIPMNRFLEFFDSIQVADLK